MSRRPTEEGMLVRAFAEHLGCSVQWARKLKREGAREWLEFTKAEASCVPGVGARESSGAAAANAGSAQSDLDRALEAKEIAWQGFCAAAKNAREGAALDLVQRVALARAMKEARDVYEKAVKHAAASQITAQRWVPFEQVAAIRDAMAQLGDVVQNWETTLAGFLPDEMRPAFHDAFQRSKPAWNAGVSSLDAYILSLLPASC